MSGTLALGFVAACCSTMAFLPQVIKTWRTRSAGDISLPTFATIVTGSVLWIIYASLQSDLPVLLANGIIFILASTIVWLKIRYPSTTNTATPPPDLGAGRASS